MTRRHETYGESDHDMDHPSVRAVEQKEAWREQLAGARLSTRAIADIVGVSVSTLHAWADVAQDTHVPGARIPSTIMATPENPALVRYWAGLVGCTLVKLPQAGTEPVDVCQLAELAQSFAAMLQQHAAAMRDGRWTAREVEILRPIATELAARALAHLAYAERSAKVEALPSARRAS